MRLPEAQAGAPPDPALDSAALAAPVGSAAGAAPALPTAHAAPAVDALRMAASFFVLAFIAVHMAREPHAITNVWFANAAAIAILGTAARARWPLLLTALAVANVAASWMLRGNLALSASFVPGNVVEVAIGAWLLQRFDLARHFDASPFAFAKAVVAGGLLPQLAGATIGAATLHGYGFTPFSSAWVNWYDDSTLGALAMLPLALALRRAQLDGTPTLLATPASMLFLGLVLGVAFAAFHWMPTPFVVLALPLVASVFFVAPTVTFALCFISVWVVCAGIDYRWFALPDGFAASTGVFLYLPAAAAVLPAQLLALVLPRMRQLQADTDALSLAANDAAAVVDERGVIRSLNPAHERLWGRPREAQVGHAIEAVVSPRNLSMVRESVDQALRGSPVQMRVERDTPSGTRVLDLSYQPVPDADGRISRVLFTAHDVTELLTVQRELERNVEHLRKANEGMQQFVRIASHDMREPLNTIAQFCGLIASDHAQELTPAAQLYFEQVGSGAARMRTLLDDVLSFARLDDEAGVTLGEVALDGVADTVLAALAGRIGERQARVEVMKPLPSVLGQHSLLVLLLQNLVANGIKFAPPGQQPQVRISAREEGELVVLTIADQGIGIALADQNQLFTPFKRLHTRRQYDGTGLGLAISKRIVERMNGSIGLESQPGAGTQVHVRLPRPPTAAGAASLASQTPPAS